MTKARSNAVANAAKGDLTVGTGTNLSGILPVSSQNGDTIVADSSTATGLSYAGNYAAGKNKIINGDFGIWQRGTSFTLSNGPVNTFCADRFVFEAYGSGTAATVTRQTFTPGAAPVAGYESQFFARLTNFATASAWQIRQRIENVQTFAGQTVTFSFWAKASTAVSGVTFQTMQNFGSGGSSAVTVDVATGKSFTTSWAQYSVTASIASITGKTIGTGSYLEFNFYQGSGATNSGTIDTWGWQAEQGSVATAFQTATGTIQGELAACQRYYWRSTGGAAYSVFGGNCSAWSGTDLLGGFNLPVTMRTNPTSVEYSSLIASDGVNNNSVGTLTFSAAYSSPNVGGFSATSTSLTAFRFYRIQANNSTSAYIAYSAEL